MAFLIKCENSEIKKASQIKEALKCHFCILFKIAEGIAIF